MLKGDVFAEQVFENQIFALFINTFLNGNDGVASDYKNAMALTYTGKVLNVASGAVCIQGRFLEESTSYQTTMTEVSKYHILAIEIDLDKTNTAQNFTQGYYKLLTGNSAYPSLTKNDIVKNVSGVYQYELCRFQTDSNGNITNFQDKRTFLDIDSIYDAIEASTTALINSIRSDGDQLIDDLEDELAQARSGSLYALKGDCYFKNGDYWGASQYQVFSGYVSADGEDLNIFIKMDKNLRDINYVDINTCKLSIYGKNGLIGGSTNKNYKDTIQRTPIMNDGTGFCLQLAMPGGFSGAVANTPIVATVENSNGLTLFCRVQSI